MKKLLIFIILLALIGGAAYYFRQKKALEEQQRAEAVKKIDLSVKVRGFRPEVQPYFQNGFQENGSVEVDSSIILKSKTMGRLDKLLVKQGDTVKAGQPVAIIEHDQLDAQLDVVKADLEVAFAQLKEAKINVEDAEREYKRYQNLFKQGYCTEQDLTRQKTAYLSAQAAVEVAKASIERTESSIKQVEVDIDETTIYATVSGIVADDFAHAVGEVVKDETSLVEIIDLSTCYVRVYVAQQDMAHIHQDKEVEIILDQLNEKSIMGKIWRIQPKVNEQTRTVRVDIALDKTEDVRPGMFVKAYFINKRQTNVTVVPTYAIQDLDAEPYLWLADSDNQVQKFPVKPGITNGKSYAIAEPLPARSIILTSGIDNLTTEDKVKVTF